MDCFAAVATRIYRNGGAVIMNHLDKFLNHRFGGNLAGVLSATPNARNALFIYAIERFIL